MRHIPSYRPARRRHECPTHRFAFLLVLGLLLAAPTLDAAAQVQSASLTATAGLSGAPGDTVVVEVVLGDLVNVEELSTVKFALAYDADVVSPVDATPGLVLDDWPATDVDASVGERGYTVVGLTSPAVSVIEGVLFRFRFEVNADAIDAAVGLFEIVGVEAGEPPILLDAPDAPETGIKVATLEGDVTVSDGLLCTPGDVTTDGSVDVADAILVLRSVVGLATLNPLQECNADADGNGTVDSGDAVRILRTVVGLARSAAHAQPARATLERTPQGARLVVEPAMGLHGLEASLRTRGGASIGTLPTAPHGLRVDAAEGTLHRIAWASTEPLADGASALVLDLPVRGEGSVELAGLSVFDAEGAPVELRLDDASVPSAASRVSLANHPNPFNPTTRVSFELPRAGWVRMELFNTAGERVRVLVDGEMAAGRNEVSWNGTDDDGRAVASGVYFVRLVSEVGTARHRLVLAK